MRVVVEQQMQEVAEQKRKSMWRHPVHARGAVMLVQPARNASPLRSCAELLHCAAGGWCAVRYDRPAPHSRRVRESPLRRHRSSLPLGGSLGGHVSQSQRFNPKYRLPCTGARSNKPAPPPPPPVRNCFPCKSLPNIAVVPLRLDACPPHIRLTGKKRVQSWSAPCTHGSLCCR